MPLAPKPSPPPPPTHTRSALTQLIPLVVLEQLGATGSETHSDRREHHCEDSARDKEPDGAHRDLHGVNHERHLGGVRVGAGGEARKDQRERGKVRRGTGPLLLREAVCVSMPSPPRNPGHTPSSSHLCEIREPQRALVPHSRPPRLAHGAQCDAQDHEAGHLGERGGESEGGGGRASAGSGRRERRSVHSDHEAGHLRGTGRERA